MVLQRKNDCKLSSFLIYIIVDITFLYKPIQSTRPVLVLLGALFLFGEKLNTYQWIGVVIAIISVYLLSRSGKREGIDFSHSNG